MPSLPASVSPFVLCRWPGYHSLCMLRPIESIGIRLLSREAILLSDFLKTLPRPSRGESIGWTLSRRFTEQTRLSVTQFLSSSCHHLLYAGRYIDKCPHICRHPLRNSSVPCGSLAAPLKRRPPLDDRSRTLQMFEFHLLDQPTASCLDSPSSPTTSVLPTASHRLEGVKCELLSLSKSAQF